jgi:hypothetical protein
LEVERAMVWKLAAAGAALLGAWQAPVLAEGHYVVRNATSRAFTCGVRREGRSVIDRFVIRAGEEWRQTTRGAGRRSLLCDSYKFTPRFRMWSGIRYDLVGDPHSGRVVLIAAGPAR